MMKGKTTLKNIFLRTACTFFIFYFIVIIVFTEIYYKIKVDENTTQFNYMQSVLQDRIFTTISYIEDERLSEGRESFSDNNLKLNADLNDLSELSGTISYFTSSFSKEMFSKTYLYDENCKKIIDSKNLLWIQTEEAAKSEKDYASAERCIDLDKYFSEDEEMELIKLSKNNNSQAYFIKCQGYISGNEIIPEVIDIYKNTVDEPISVDEGIKSAEKIKTYNFNVQGVDGLKKIDIADYFNPNWEIHYDSEIYSFNTLNKKVFQRYNSIKEYKKEELKSLIDKRGYTHTNNNISKTLGKVSYDYIYTLTISDHKYYMVLEANYYPWDDIFLKCIPLYIISFIILLAMTIILSKGLYKTYATQEELEKNRRELTSAIAHELKTPLGIIRTYGEGLKEKIAEDKRDKYLEVIIDETYRMDKMVLEMLDLSKLEAKAYELKKEEFCLNDLVEEIIKKNEKLFNDKNINVNYNSDKKYNINADYVRIEQVINNLISNAIYHTDENKTINISAENQTISIENEGENIPKDKLNLIWETFYRGDDSRARSERRTGIGLAIVKNILQLHNMEFGVENTTLGVKFWFKL
ncbi:MULTISPECIES: HAMP domain-containing sensor histidine kinase [unclassified Clostridium]|uniref:sensor histidine kinase n=1 Tax=unclassified Clostridium TaxID=2614128 RepID=UPI0002983796|nr:MULTISPECIES: HAMP domain-containing sensor histidine kinase [unclassified Clostridium]EKQ55122.1 MAG: histidine kinase [Clostridium sp. Maddingley MBC34-26]